MVEKPDFGDFCAIERTSEILVQKIEPLIREIAEMEFFGVIGPGLYERDEDDFLDACRAADVVKRYLCSCVDGALAESLVQEFAFRKNELAYRAMTEYLHRSGADCEVPHEC